MRFDVERLAKLDVDGFTIEDVMCIFHMWRWVARAVMNTAVRRGDFVKQGEFYKFIK